MATRSNQVNLNWASDIVNIMQGAGSDFNSPDIMLGEVVTAPPALTIKVGNVVLYKEQLLVADYLLKDYKRAYLAEGIAHITAKADEELKGMTKPRITPEAEVPETTLAIHPGTPPHTHEPHAHGVHTHPEHDHELKEIEITTTKDKFTAHGDGDDPVISDDGVNDGKADKKYFWFKDTLKPKDLVLVQQLPNSHYFVVLNRLIRMEDVKEESKEAQP